MLVDVIQHAIHRVSVRWIPPIRVSCAGDNHTRQRDAHQIFEHGSIPSSLGVIECRSVRQLSISVCRYMLDGWHGQIDTISESFSGDH
jgi:hypothetical protein